MSTGWSGKILFNCQQTTAREKAEHGYRIAGRAQAAIDRANDGDPIALSTAIDSLAAPCDLLPEHQSEKAA